MSSTFGSIADAIPILGPLLADAQFRWWLLGIYLAIGPIPEEIQQKDAPSITKWRWGGLLRVALIGAIGHSKLGDRVGALETSVKDNTNGMRAVVAELQAWREVLARFGMLTPVARTDVGGVAATGAAGCDEVPQASQGRRAIASRPQ